MEKPSSLQFCGFSLIALLLLWSPQAILHLWPVALGTASLNIHLTLLPPLLSLTSPLCVGLLALETVPRLRAARRWDPTVTQRPLLLEEDVEPLFDLEL